MGDFDLNIEKSVADAVEDYKAQAAKMMVDAFNQGYLLGQQQAKVAFGGGEDEN